MALHAQGQKQLSLTYEGDSNSLELSADLSAEVKRAEAVSGLNIVQSLCWGSVHAIAPGELISRYV